MSAPTKVINCDNQQLFQLATLLTSCFAKGSDGAIFLRTVVRNVSSASCATESVNASNCDNNVIAQMETLLRQSIVLDNCGNPALMLGVVV